MDKRDPDVKERILLVIRISTDKQHIESVARELHRSRARAYKWYKRYNNERLEGLKDKPRSGKPPAISTETMEKIKQELSGSSTGWDFRQVINIIQKKTGVKHHKVHTYWLLRIWGFVSKVPQNRFVRTASQKEKKVLKKNTKSPGCA